MSVVEDTLRNQRETWREICSRMTGLDGDLPPENPRRILLFGVGSSHHAAKLAAYSLMRDRNRTRVPVFACTSLEMGVSVVPQHGDWAFGLTHRGTTVPTMKALEMANRNGAFTVQVSGKGVSTQDFIRLMLPTSEVETVEPHTVSVTGAVCAVTSLLLGLKVLEEWDALRWLGDPNLEQMRERAGHGPALVVGEWEGEWIAREAALKLMEMARHPARAFSSEEFWHGPRHSFKSGSKDRLWHVSTARDERGAGLDAALRVEVAGSSPISWVPALVELQWLSLATALNLNVDPDLKPNSGSA